MHLLRIAVLVPHSCTSSITHVLRTYSVYALHTSNDTSSLPAAIPRKLDDWPVTNCDRNFVGATDFPKLGAMAAITKDCGREGTRQKCMEYVLHTIVPIHDLLHLQDWRMGDIHTLSKLGLKLSVCFVLSLFYSVLRILHWAVSVHYEV